MGAEEEGIGLDEGVGDMIEDELTMVGGESVEDIGKVLIHHDTDLGTLGQGDVLELAIHLGETMKLGVPF